LNQLTAFICLILNIIIIIVLSNKKLKTEFKLSGKPIVLIRRLEDYLSDSEELDVHTKYLSLTQGSNSMTGNSKDWP
jgi:hypothetical protein